MQYREKNDGGIEIHLNPSERKLMFRALRHYSAYDPKEEEVMENIPLICQILNVLDLKGEEK
jgi:hypothetical protein